MSGPVDVLAVMDDVLSPPTGMLAEEFEALHEARAAVAELIEAAKEMRANFRCVLEVNCNCDEEFIARQTENVDAALARVQGGAE